MSRYNELLDKLNESATTVQPNGFMAKCCSHDDAQASLSVRELDGRMHLHCFAGCSEDKILSDLGFVKGDLYVNSIDSNSSDRINDVVGMVYNSIIQKLTLSQQHENQLLTRGLNMDMVRHNGYRTLSYDSGKQLKERLFSEFGLETLKQVPGLFNSEGKLLGWPTGIIIPIRRIDGSIQGVQVRTDSGQPKYYNPRGQHVGVHIPLMEDKSIYMSVRLTEGPLKADIASYLDQGTLTISVIGVNDWKQFLPVIKQLNSQSSYVAFDMDWQKNQSVAKSMLSLAQAIEGSTVYIETWNNKYKGIDDALAAKQQTELHPVAMIEDIINKPRRDELDEVVTASSVEMKRTEWIWKGWLPAGSATIMDGDPGLGKSQITAILASAITTGGKLPDESICNTRGSVIFMSAEDSPERTIVPRLKAVEADLSKIQFYKYVRRGDSKHLPSLPNDFDRLEAIIQGSQAKLLIIDPFFAYLDKGVDSFRDQDVRKVMDRLGRIAEKYQLSILILRHLSKGNSGNVLYRGSGSIGIVAAVRTGWLVARDPSRPSGESGGILAVQKSNLGPFPASLRYGIQDVELPGGIETSRIVWEGSTDLSSTDLANAKPALVTEADRRMGWLANLIHERGELSGNDLRIACEHSGYSYIKVCKLNPVLLARYNIEQGADNVWRTSQAKTQVSS